MKSVTTKLGIGSVLILLLYFVISGPITPSSEPIDILPSKPVDSELRVAYDNWQFVLKAEESYQGPVTDHELTGNLVEALQDIREYLKILQKKLRSGKALTERERSYLEAIFRTLAFEGSPYSLSEEIAQLLYEIETLVMENMALELQDMIPKPDQKSDD